MNLINMSAWAAILIIAVIIIRALLLHKIAKRTFIVLWCIVLLRLLLPFELPADLLPFSLPDFGTSIENVIAAEQGENSANALGGQMPEWNLQPIEGNQTAALPWKNIIYFAGLLGCAGFFILTHWHFLRKCADSLPLDSFVTAELKSRHKVRLRCSDRITLPFTYGILKPTIILPKGIYRENTDRQKIVLLHEYMHIYHHDIFLKYLLAAALCLHWFNPLVWVMYIIANRDIELACDEAVLRAMGAENRSVYAMALISLEEHKAGFAPLCSGFNKNAIEERIKAIMKTKKLSFFGKILSAMLVFAIVFITATSAIAESPKNEENKQTVITEEKTDIQPEQVKTSAAPEITAPPAAALPEADKPAEPEEPSVNVETSAKPELISPLANADLTAAFGVRFHPVTKDEILFDHITLTAEGDEIFAAASGVVIECGYAAEKGNTLVLEHEGGIVTAYTHCSSFAVAKGDKVSQGDVIGYMGATGMATGKCLGFYVYVDGIACDPLNFIDIEQKISIGEPEIGN